MSHCKLIFPAILLASIALTSCNTLEKASLHGFNSGYYTLGSGKDAKKVYADVSDEKIEVYNLTGGKVDKDIFMSVSNPDSLPVSSLNFRKQSLDIDITTILLKYRPSVSGLPSQLTSDLNVSLYAGWRHDNYKILRTTDPLGKSNLKISNLGFDYGFFAGPGTTGINPFTTNNKTTDEYSGMIIQTGIAGFLETNFASFGIAVGLDNLLNRDSDIWIYNNKPWVGFIVGIALN